MSSISLVISPQSVEYVGGPLDPDADRASMPIVLCTSSRAAPGMCAGSSSPRPI